MSADKHTVTDFEVKLDLDHADKMVATKIRSSVNGFSRDQIEEAIVQELSADEWHRQRSAIAALRAGALFLCLKSQMGKGYTGFWEHCEARFKVPRSSISKKMRLAVRWLAANGGKPSLITKLATATELDPSKADSKAVQLAFDWIGENTTTDLYRREKLVNYGPQGGNQWPKDKERHRRTRGAIDAERDAKAALENFRWLRMDIDICHSSKLYELLDDSHLARLRERLIELQNDVSSIATSRGLKRLGDQWRMTEPKD